MGHGYRATTRTKIAKRRKEVAALYLRGATQYEIATRLDVNQATISRDLKALQEEWLHSALVNIDELKAKELAKIDALEVEYWLAWESSLEEYKSTTVKGRGARESVDAVEKTVKTEERNGDPRYLTGVQWCINKRCELLGLDAPKKIGGSDDPILIKVVRSSGTDGQSS